MIANLDVSEGPIISPSIEETRNEQDFQEHISRTVASDPLVKKWLFVVDKGTAPPVKHTPIEISGVVGGRVGWFIS